jgi:hypothetical protein
MKLRIALTCCTLAFAAAVAAPLAGAKPAVTEYGSVFAESVGAPDVDGGYQSRGAVQGVATGDGKSQGVCDAYAGLIEDYVQGAIDAAEVNDVGSALDKLDRAEAVEDAALNDGCSISYPA